MKKRIGLLAAGGLLLAGVICAATLQKSETRPPAVAGLFYPAEKEKLSTSVQNFLDSAQTQNIEKIRGLVCPHAGYEFSGPVAASSYKQLIEKDFKTAIILAPSHYAAFHGVYVSSANFFETPLGKIKVSSKAKELAKLKPFTSSPVADIQRPNWAAQSPLKDIKRDTPGTWEHSLEVQLPFLQKALPKCEIIPLIFGFVNPQDVANALVKFLDDKTILIASSDLSHYYPYEAAKKLDSSCTQAVVNLDLDSMKNQEACGQVPIMALMCIAKQKGWQAKLLNYRNSGDTAGDKSRVVGYVAIAFVDASSKPFVVESSALPKPQNQSDYTDTDKKFMLNLARKTLEEIVTKNKLPDIDEKTVPEKLQEVRGCFVTLTINKELRGCIGHIIPQEALYKSVMDNARSAAIYDFRFPKVQSGELKQIEIEVSVLTQPQPLPISSAEDLLAKLRPNIDGVVLKIGARQATYLPQVWEHFPKKEDFLNTLAQKAGCAASAWRDIKNVEVQTYQVEAFQESDK